MKQRLNTLILFVVSILVSSCAGYVNQMHREMDRENGKTSMNRNKSDPFSNYRKKSVNPNSSDEMVAPKTYSLASTRDEPEVDPRVKRVYNTNLTKRHSASDLTDNSNGGSLWSAGQDNFLFSKNKAKKTGDIIIIKVLEKLRNDIATELRRAFPLGTPKKKAPEVAKDKKEVAKTDGVPNVEKKEDAAAKEKEKESSAADENVYDSISSLIVEDVNNDYVLLRAKKEVLYKKEKHLLEIQVLVNRQDITDDNTVMSDRIIESSISVLR